MIIHLMFLGNLLIHIQFIIILVYFPVTEAQTFFQQRRIRGLPSSPLAESNLFLGLWLHLYKLHSVISSGHA